VKTSLLRLLQRARLLGPAYRAYESLQARRAPRGEEATDAGLPVPPAPLRVRVAGTADLDWFVEGGRLGADAVRDALARAGVHLAGLDAMLDFGCGCGRVTRYWADFEGHSVAGSDQDAVAVAWCRENLPFARFETNALAPPLAFASGAFDVVYALSVFTHLTEELGLAWRDELRRVLRPGGHLLLSTHGGHYRDRLDAEEGARFDRGELVVRWESVAGTNLCSAFHPEAYVRDALSEGFEVVDFQPEGARGNPHQDLVLLRKA
jgi:SAM-dependent methyltransferase